jgi:hypothetical protein
MTPQTFLHASSFAILGSLLFVACQKPTPKVEAPLVAEVSPAPSVVSAKVVPAEKPQPEVADQKPADGPVNAAAPVAPELAPPGVFYLVSEVRLETDSGITGLPPGTGVKLLHDDVYLTPAGEAHLTAEQLTNNLAVARTARDADRATQTAAQARIANEGAVANARARAEAAAVAGQLADAPSSVTTSPNTATPAPSYSNPLNRATDPLNTTHTSTKDKVYKDAAGRLYWKDIYGKAHYFQ